jgi:esterase/lipase superfamily enzyme
MKIEYYSEYSANLERNMEFKIYGHQGKPVLVFPTSRGRFYQYEDFGMIGAISGFIESGLIQVWTCDGIDGETFMTDGGHPRDRIRQHERYVRYVTDELIPQIKGHSKWCNSGSEYPLLATGCSLGAYHSANMFFRFPWHFDSLIALSGVYSTGTFFGTFMDQDTYYNSPLHYLANLTDDDYLEKYRRSKIVICCGRGNFEDQMVADTLKIKDILTAKNIDAWIDIWGEDVNHDWNWWRMQMPYFLGKYFNQSDRA